MGRTARNAITRERFPCGPGAIVLRARPRDDTSGAHPRYDIVLPYPDTPSRSGSSVTRSDVIDRSPRTCTAVFPGAAALAFPPPPLFISLETVRRDDGSRRGPTVVTVRNRFFSDRRLRVHPIHPVILDVGASVSPWTFFQL